MQIALLTDLHYGVRGDSSIFHDYYAKCFAWFFDEIDKRKIDTIICLGDVFDRRKYVAFTTSYQCRKSLIEPLRLKQRRSYFIAGNHDMYHRNDHEINSLEELLGGRHPNIHTYSTPKLINVGGLNIQLIPWITDSNRLEATEAIQNPKTKVLMGHLELSGFDIFGNGMIDHDRGENPSIYSNYEVVLSGHYHHRSKYKNIEYIGAFSEQTWTDWNDPRGFTIFDTKTLQTEFIQNPHKMFRVIVYDDVKEPDVFLTIKSMDFSLYTNTYVKIVISNKKDPYAFDMLLDNIYKSNPIDISIMERDVLSEHNPELIDLNSSVSSQKLLMNYIDEIKDLIPDIEPDRMKLFMNEVYKDALQLGNNE